jgi:hypothetical protein
MKRGRCVHGITKGACTALGWAGTREWSEIGLVTELVVPVWVAGLEDQVNLSPNEFRVLIQSREERWAQRFVDTIVVLEKL